MNLKTTVYLLIALTVIGVGFLILFPKGEVEIEVHPQDGSGRSLFSAKEFYPDGLRTVQVKWDDGREVTLERDLDGNWMETQPVRFPLHREKMQRGLANTAAILMYTDRFKPGVEGKPPLEETGLDRPKAVITFKGAFHNLDPSGTKTIDREPYEQTIALGKTTVGGRGYVRVNEGPDIYVVNQDLHQILMRSPMQSWRIKHLSGPIEAQAKRLKLMVEGETFVMRKVSGGEWMLDDPHSGRVNPSAIRALLYSLQSVRIGHRASNR